MIQKYYNSILEQVFAQIGKKEHNIVLAKYSNDFSLKQLEISEQITNNKRFILQPTNSGQRNYREHMSRFWI